jgi:signal peptidase I
MPTKYAQPFSAQIGRLSAVKRPISKWHLTLIIVAVLVFLYLITTYIVTPIEVRGISMQPTLHTYNVVLVWEWPQTWATITNSQYIPKRGSIVVLQKTAVSEEELIKRVIGLPGDNVSIVNGTVKVSNSSKPAGFNPDSAPYGKNLAPIFGSYSAQVPVGQIFVLGDNRSLGASIDSRSSIGSIESTTIIGQAVVRIYPLNRIKLF